MKKTRKAIALLSGGLDSMIAAKIVKDQGVEVIGLHLSSPFACREDVQKVADTLEIPLRVKEKGESYLDLVQNPRHGYGRAMNPCIDCRIFMFQLADVVRQDEQADFIVTGEVVGQRPMSQNRGAMELIDRSSPLADLIVRPLSAQILPPSLPEREGWLDRQALHDWQGRTRKPQLEFVDKARLSNFSAPGGGCLLTETEFAPRLRDYYEHPHYESSQERLTQSEMLRVGRHFRVRPDLKVILARNAEENKTLETLWESANGTIFRPDGFGGPTGVALGTILESDKPMIGEMITRYSKSELAEKPIQFQSKKDSGSFRVTKAMPEDAMKAIRL